uniref:Uncharacterized protein n=1 Tax=Phocoena sinus TaxID=42100 RepID=A0A8C9B0V1_PHOSS
MYSRECNCDFQYRGKIRVQIYQEDGRWCLIHFLPCKSVMYGAEIIRQLKISTQKIVNDHQSSQRKFKTNSKERNRRNFCLCR